MLASDERGPTDPNELSPPSYWPSPSVSDQVKTLMKLESSPDPRGLPCPAASPASVSVSRREFSWSSLLSAIKHAYASLSDTWSEMTLVPQSAGLMSSNLKKRSPVPRSFSCQSLHCLWKFCWKYSLLQLPSIVS